MCSVVIKISQITFLIGGPLIVGTDHCLGWSMFRSDQDILDRLLDWEALNGGLSVSDYNFAWEMFCSDGDLLRSPA